ncbi:MAG: hypothetical protein Q7T86_13860 [Hyphomicrobiaceae bacterium]|nr:hypothetical protein [Hyphomicrobiaceae bacterium]
MTAAQQPPALDDLTEAERFLVQSTIRGEPADLRRHNVRGSIIRDLLLEARPGWVLPAAGLRVHKAIIDGGLELEGCTLTKPFLLWHSRVQGGGDRGAILIRDARLKRLGIHSCTIEGNIIADRVQVESGIFLGGGLVRGVLQIRGAEVNGALAVEGSEIGNGKAAIMAAGLRLTGPLIVRRAKIKGELSFPRAQLTSGIYGEDAVINCDGIAVNGESARLAGDLLLDRANITGALRLANARIGGKFAADHLIVAASPAAIDANNLHVENGLSLSGARIAGSVSLEGADIGKHFRAESIEIWGGEMAIAADVIRIGGNWDLARAKIFGQISCPGAKIIGHLRLTDARIQAGDIALRGDSADVRGGCFMSRAKITGLVRFPSAQIGNQFRLRSASIRVERGPAVLASGATFDRDVELGDGFETAGAVVLDQSDISGVCDLKGSKLTSATLSRAPLPATGAAAPPSDEAAAASAIAAEPPDEIASSNDALTARYDNIVLSFVDAQIASLEMPMTAQDRPRGIVDLSRARVGSFLDFAAAWPPNPGFRGWSAGREVDHLVLDGFTYAHLMNPSGALAGATAPPRYDDSVGERRVAWLEGQDLPDIHDHFKPQAWVQLASRLSGQGYHDDARAITIARRRRQAGARSTTRGQRWQARILDLFALYGYNPWRTVVWMAVMIIAFAGVWTWAASHCSDRGCGDETVFVVSNRDAYTPDKFATSYPAFNALGYSFDVFVPFIPFGYEDHWRPNLNWRPFAEVPLPDIGKITGTGAAPEPPVLTLTLGGVLYLAAILEMLIGLILTSLAVTGFTGMLRSDE